MRKDWPVKGQTIAFSSSVEQQCFSEAWQTTKAMVCPTSRTMVRQATSLPHLGANLYPEIDCETTLRMAGHRLFCSDA